MSSSKGVLTEDFKAKCVRELRSLLKGDDRLRNLQSDDDYLLRFLYCCDFNVEKAFERMKMFYDLLLEYPEWFTKEGPLKKKDLIEKDIRVMLPKRDKQGRPIYIVKLANINVSKMDLLDIVGVDDCWMEFIANDQKAREMGVCVIIDIKDFPWKLTKWMTPHVLSTSVKKLQSFPFKEFRFHVVNSALLVNAAVKIIWPFLTKEIKEMIKFHFEDWASLHEYINPENLPPEYKGFADFDVKECYNDLFSKNNEIVERFQQTRALNKINY